jgi:hypothetical protein
MAEEKKPIESNSFEDEMRLEIKRLNDKISELEKPYHATPKQPITDIITDSNFFFEQVDGTVQLGLDVDAFREQIPPLPNTMVDRYQHCTEPEEYGDVFLPSDVATGIEAGGGFDEGLTDIVLRITTPNGGKLCYFLADVNVKHALSENVTVESQVDSCDACEDDPASGDGGGGGGDGGIGDPNFPIDFGIFVTDVNCADDGSGDLLVSFTNTLTGLQTVERKTGCCCDSGDSGGDSGDLLDQWESCDSGSLPDIYLNPSIFENATAADPIIALSDNGCCYKIAARETTGNVETDYNLISYLTGCDDAGCDDCTDAPASCPYVDTDSGATVISVSLGAWDGEGIEGSSGNTIVLGKTADVTDQCGAFYPPVFWNKRLDRNTNPAGLSVDTTFAQYCFWYVATGNSNDFNGFVGNSIVMAGYNTDLSAWVAIVTQVFDDTGVNCADRRSVWVKSEGDSEIGTFGPATQAQLVTMGLNTDTYVRPTNGTFQTTFVS